MSIIFINIKWKLVFSIGSIILCLPWTSQTKAAELFVNPREILVERWIRGQSSTLVIAENVNVRNLPTKIGNGGFVFAQLNKGDSVYVLSCEGFYEGHFWVKIWIPEVGEIGFIAGEFLQNNYQRICDRSRTYWR